MVNEKALKRLNDSLNSVHVAFFEAGDDVSEEIKQAAQALIESIAKENLKRVNGLTHIYTLEYDNNERWFIRELTLNNVIYVSKDGEGIAFNGHFYQVWYSTILEAKQEIEKRERKAFALQESEYEQAKKRARDIKGEMEDIRKSEIVVKNMNGEIVQNLGKIYF
jgi:predicted heme/steroid binding protein